MGNLRTSFQLMVFENNFLSSHSPLTTWPWDMVAVRWQKWNRQKMPEGSPFLKGCGISAPGWGMRSWNLLCTSAPQSGPHGRPRGRGHIMCYVDERHHGDVARDHKLTFAAPSSELPNAIPEGERGERRSLSWQCFNPHWTWHYLSGLDGLTALRWAVQHKVRSNLSYRSKVHQSPLRLQ